MGNILSEWMEAMPVLSNFLIIFGKSLLALILAWVIIRICRSLTRRLFTKHLVRVANCNRVETLKRMIDNIITCVVLFIAIVTILGFFGVNVASILAAAGVLGVAIGFGAQTLVKDTISGFFLILENQIAVGERVKINSFEGYVEAVEMRITRVKGINGELFIVPNGSITQVINYSRYPIRVEVAVSFSDQGDTAAIHAAIETAVAAYYAEQGDAIAVAPSITGLESVSADAVTVNVTAEVRPNHEEDVKRGLRAAIVTALEQRGDVAPFTIQ